MSRSKLIATLVALLSFIVLPSIAAAHEHREVGKYEFTVGFINEPAFEGEQNGIWVKVLNHETEAPIENLADTLKTQVIMGSQTLDLALEPAWNEPGVYTADFYPTEDGDYTFRFFGTVEGTQVDEKFTSSPEGFSSVQATDAIQFPVKVPATAQLSAEVASAQRTAQIALALGGIGLVVGLVGAVVALRASRGRNAAAPAAGRSAART